MCIDTASWSMRNVFLNYVDNQERGRILRLEMFDDFEEWDLFMAYYFFALGIKNMSFFGFIETNMGEN